MRYPTLEVLRRWSAASKPALPAAEIGGVYGVDPQLTASERNDFRPQNPQAAAFGATAWSLDCRHQGNAGHD
jgi:GDP-D-mannose dehydratase